MSVQTRIRAGVMLGATGVIALGAAYGIVGSPGPSSPSLERVAATTTPTVTTSVVSAHPVVAQAVTSTSTSTTTSRSTITVTSKATVMPTVTTVLTLTAGKNPVTKAQQYRAVLRGVLTANKKPLAGQSILLLRRVTGTTAWSPVSATDTTSLRGDISFAVLQTEASVDYKMVYSGKGTYLSVLSPTVKVLKK
jgi:hypothetical protein